jgi:glycosyltransferase involved in cell wall biosynthesis
MSVGVNLVGYLDAEVGTGEAGRLVATALTAAGVPHADVGEVATASRRAHPFAFVTPAQAHHPVNVLCLNADMLPAFAQRAGPGFFADRRTVGFWFWEVTTVPSWLLGSLALVDEVWVASAHVAAAFAPVSAKPVIRMPLPIPIPPAALEPLPPTWPAAPTFLFAFDHLSVFARKNPLGVVEAFRRAFPRPGNGRSLVVKSINGHQAPETHARLVEAAAGRPDIELFDGYVSAGQMRAMTAACVAYVSLHRAEGFGLTMAQAMACGRPVIATGYSGNLDFMTPFNAYLVDHRLVAVGDGAPPYPPEAEWAEPDLDHAAWSMRRVLERPHEAAARAVRGQAELAERRSPVVSGAAMRARLELLAGEQRPQRQRLSVFRRSR